MPSLEDRVATLERQLTPLKEIAAAIQGKPASALISIPHNDSWLFEENVDGPGGFPGNLRYVISSNVQRVVSASLSIHLAAYRTYNSLAFSATGAGSAHSHSHSHTSAAHTHTIPYSGNGGAFDAVFFDTSTSPAPVYVGVPASGQAGPTASTTPGSTGTNAATEASHTHSISGSSVLGITEGAVASGVSLSFDGVDQTSALGGPFSSDVIELNVLRYLPQTKGVFHVIAMTPTGLGRIEAHLRLGVYVAAGSVF
jgi:hypothetical protein